MNVCFANEMIFAGCSLLRLLVDCDQPQCVAIDHFDSFGISRRNAFFHCISKRSRRRRKWRNNNNTKCTHILHSYRLIVAVFWFHSSRVPHCCWTAQRAHVVIVAAIDFSSRWSKKSRLPSIYTRTWVRAKATEHGLAIKNIQQFIWIISHNSSSIPSTRSQRSRLSLWLRISVFTGFVLCDGVAGRLSFKPKTYRLVAQKSTSAHELCCHLSKWQIVYCGVALNSEMLNISTLLELMHLVCIAIRQFNIDWVEEKQQPLDLDSFRWFCIVFLSLVLNRIMQSISPRDNDESDTNGDGHFAGNELGQKPLDLLPKTLQLDIRSESIRKKILEWKLEAGPT